MKIPSALFLLIFVASPCLSRRIFDEKILSFNVMNYGAKGDGQSDDSQAFLKAWKDVCDAMGTPTLFIPNGKTFLLQPLQFQGPCKAATIIVQLQGSLVAPEGVNNWKWTNGKGPWIDFSNINGLVVNGRGQIDGKGASWWKTNPSDQARPTALAFNGCNNLRLSHLTYINSPRNHLSIDSCHGARISNLHMVAPGNSPNTDGIDIAASSNIIISNSKMETGDDCIAINGGSSFINITGVACGPGHGISVGSLGENGAHEIVEEIHVQHCNFTQSTNGARIKTWQGGSGYARKITFEDITLNAVQNPIIIDQHYGTKTLAAATAVQVSDVTYRDIRGTSASEIAINLNCDNAVGCTNIVLDNIKITSSIPGKTTSAFCNAVQGTISQTIPNVPCIKKMFNLY